ncbi:uncharacterized protein [Nerophis lumbriciformis]|uniref:uncharacterized protein n=1 Tax=Nerophis lumbriciformis TaxID=546530 RepID=UPI002AE067DB|nr:uncharacterized protein LOC133583186 [Nerophis lumbriciformis]
MMPLSKADPKLQYNSLPNPSVRYQHSTRRLPSCSSTSGSSGTAELLLGGPALKNLLHQSSSVYSQRGPAVTGRTDGTSSAYSSPRIPKREAPRSKDTLDLRTDSLTQRALRDLQLRRNTNKNWTFGKYRQRNVDNADSSEKEVLCRQQSGRGHVFTRGPNRNVVSLDGMGVRSISNQDRGASKRKVSKSGRVDMAVVAPFGFR